MSIYTRIALLNLLQRAKALGMDLGKGSSLEKMTVAQLEALVSGKEKEIPRRSRLDQNTPAELAIRAAVDAVEALPADVRLTHAVVLLQEAREAVADYVDGVAKARLTEKDKSCRTCRWLTLSEDGRPLCEIGVRGMVDRETGLCAAWVELWRVP